MVLAALGELAEERGKGIDVVRDDNPVVTGSDSQHLVVGESGVLRFLVEGAHVVAVGGEPGADLRTGDVVVEQQSQNDARLDGDERVERL